MMYNIIRETLTLAKKIVKDNARSSPSELLETIKTAESMARNDKINDMRCVPLFVITHPFVK